MWLNKNRFKNIHLLWFSMALSVILPVVLGHYLSNNLPDWRWTQYPFHSMLESIGALSAIIISAVMFQMITNNHLRQKYVIVACALTGMGITDGFHAILHAGAAFVWLHSLATMIGGISFSTVWFFSPDIGVKKQKKLIYAFIITTTLISILSVLFPQYLPEMIVDGEFSLLAKILNISGGIGFLVGSAYFVFHELKHISPLSRHDNQDTIFANHCLLFGIAGLLFETSTIWDAGWWWWHILRLMAYLVVLIYFFALFRQQQTDLKTSEAMLSFANRHLEERVAARTQELEKANQAKSDFLSSMSHELRTPMNAILGFGQLLEMDETLVAEQRSSVNEILNAGNHLLELINEVLDLSRIEEGKLRLDIKKSNINKIISESVLTLTPIAKQNKVRIINNTSSLPECVLPVDPLRFKQVFLNLLANAIKYNHEKGEVNIDINFIENKRVRVLVKDTGTGISPDNLEKLFTPFERLGYNGHVEGTGIGLAFSKKITELMGGTIGYSDNTPCGSVFYLEFTV